MGKIVQVDLPAVLADKPHSLLALSDGIALPLPLLPGRNEACRRALGEECQRHIGVVLVDPPLKAEIFCILCRIS
ncbi:MAG: hypothetical protein K5695_14070 [Oscillospiraceae bacterium]|nr:hypothetical protein [Oscillospiraceae bacterium]